MLIVLQNQDEPTEGYLGGVERGIFMCPAYPVHVGRCNCNIQNMTLCINHASEVYELHISVVQSKTTRITNIYISIYVFTKIHVAVEACLVLKSIEFLELNLLYIHTVFVLFFCLVSEPFSAPPPQHDFAHVTRTE